MKRNWTTRTSLLLIGGILVALNLIGLNWFGRLDLTDNDVYTLSPASIDLVEDLDDPVTFRAFFTEDLPAPYGSNARFLRDKLDDYRAYGGGNVQYTFVDPGENEDLQEEATRFRIPPVQIQVLENDNIQIKNAYMGLAIEYGGEREILPVVQDLSTLEYDITTALRRLTSDRLPTVGFLTGHGELTLQQQLPTFQQLLQRNYTVQTVSVQADSLRPRPDVLVVASPTDSLGEATQRALDGYIMGGGRVAFLVNRVAAQLQQGFAQEQTTGLETLLATYGLRVRADLVQDAQSAALTTQRNFNGLPVLQRIDYPFLPILSNFNPDNLMVSRLPEVMLYFASTLDTETELPTGVVVEVLASSTPQSATMEGFFMIQPNPNPVPFTGGPYPLAAAYSGTFPSAFGAGQSEETRLVLVGDGDFLNEEVIQGIGQQWPGNLAFGLNLVDWLAQDDALLTIRAKTIEPRPLQPVSDGAKPLIRYFVILGPVLLVLLFGLLRWHFRRQRQIVVTA